MSRDTCALFNTGGVEVINSNGRGVAPGVSTTGIGAGVFSGSGVAVNSPIAATVGVAVDLGFHLTGRVISGSTTTRLVAIAVAFVLAPFVAVGSFTGMLLATA